MLGLCALGTLSTLGRDMVTGRVDQARASLAAHVPAVTSQFVIQADLTVVATGPLTTAVQVDLELMADLESSGAASVYRFSDQSLRRAYDAGWSAAEINAFLDAHATKGVPQPLSYLVEDVGRRHGRVRVGSAASYIRSDDPSLLAEILVTRKAAKLGLGRVAPTVLVSTAEPETVIATLRATGFLPAEEDATGALVVRRREVARATEGHGPMSARSFDDEAGQMARARAAELSQLLDQPGSVASFSLGTAGSRSTPHDLKALVDRLRAPGPSGGSGSRPSTAGAGRNGLPDTADLFHLEMRDGDQERPQAIARSRTAILDLLDEAFEQDWVVRLEYLDQRGQIQLFNATVFRMDGAHVVVGTLPGCGTRILTVTRISWVRVLTEAEEEAV